jgi:hypothetical protein
MRFSPDSMFQIFHVQSSEAEATNCLREWSEMPPMPLLWALLIVFTLFIRVYIGSNDFDKYGFGRASSGYGVFLKAVLPIVLFPRESS